jgi:hypothetical protein
VIHEEHEILLDELSDWIPDPLSDLNRHKLWQGMWDVVHRAEEYTQATYTRRETDGSWTDVYKAREQMEEAQRALYDRISELRSTDE